VFAIGDVASCPDPRLDHPIRVEHWVHAQRQGQHLARLLLRKTEAAFNDVPFFWSTHHDIGIHYIGHVAPPDVSRSEGSIEGGEFAIFLREDGEDRALVTLERDVQSLEVEAAWEQRPL
jgi:NADPH-dependent 2,4-dienoyl-CoA reductase/sulfur reductase-like enzyme